MTKAFPSFEALEITAHEEEFSLPGGALVLSLDTTTSPFTWEWRLHRNDRHPARDCSGWSASRHEAYKAAHDHYSRHGLRQNHETTRNTRAARIDALAGGDEIREDERDKTTAQQRLDEIAADPSHLVRAPLDTLLPDAVVQEARAKALAEAGAVCSGIMGTHRNAEADADDPEYHEAAGDGAEECALAVTALAGGERK